MKIFIDTANIDEIKEAYSIGVVDGVTTNPSLVAKEEGKFEDIIKNICKVAPHGPINAEVIALDTDNMVKEAKELANINPNMVIKIPMTIDGIKAVKILSKEGIKTNVTIVFSPLQSLIAAKAGATYISPYVGRLDQIAQEGMLQVKQAAKILNNYGYDAEIIVASIKSPMHILDAALAGAHIATIPLSVLKNLIAHPMTDKGIQGFLADWEKAKK